MPFIIGTAGHIDHGKTSLIKALTGQDTDRLKEEKERGISIELGFAHLDLPDGIRAGIVDVPGHERFIRTMLAGAHGMDLVLFTVAADDGVMPQTVEHVDILHLLGVAHAIFVVTKTDLVTAARVSEVTGQIRALTAGTALAGAPAIPFSCVTGEGRDRLLAEIGNALGRIHRPEPEGYFRMPVDRVFLMHGHGFVVTGTALQGEVRDGDRLRCLPGGQVYRVRSVQVHGEHVPAAGWGQRIALNLPDADRSSIERGDVLCDERMNLTSDRCDAKIEVRPSAPGPIENHQRVRVHLGTSERPAKVVLLGTTEALPPGQAAFCQLLFSRPMPALRGDRFVIRDETAQHTLGGGIILHPSPRLHRRRDPSLKPTLDVLEAGDAARIAEVFLDEQEDFASPMTSLYQFLNVRTGDVIDRLGTSPAVRMMTVDGEHFFTTSRKWNTLRETLLSSLRAAHTADPLAPGKEMEELREKLPGRVPPKLYRSWLDSLEHDGVIVREGSLLRLPEHRVTLRDEAQAAAERIMTLLAKSPLTPPDVAEMSRQTGIERSALTQVLRVLERDRSVARVTPDLYFLRDTLEGVKRVLREEFTAGTEMTPAAFRDRLAITRKHAIPLLEYLDREGLTVRVGNIRRWRS